MENDGKWCVSLSDEHFSGYDFFNTKQEAIDAGRQEYKRLATSNSTFKDSDMLGGCLDDYSDGMFYVGQIVEYKPKLDVEVIIERLMDNAFDYLGDYAEGFLADLTGRQEDELERDLQVILDKWLDKYDLLPKGYHLVSIQRVPVEV